MVVRRMEMCAQLCSRRFVIPGLKITSALAVAGVLLAGSWPAGAEVTASLPGSVLSDTTHPLSALSEDLPDAEWMRQAAEIARRVAAEPLVELTPQPATEGEIAYRLRLNRPTRDPVLRLALAVPPEGVTSAGLTLDGPPAGAGTVPPAAAQRPSEAVVTAEPLGWVRNIRIDRFVLPLQGAGERAITGTLRIRLKPGALKPETDVRAAASAAPEWAAAESRGPLRSMVERFVANPMDLDRFAARTPQEIPCPAAETAWTPVVPGRDPSLALRVPISETGLYRVSGADLASSGVPISQVEPAHLHLMLEGRELPLLHIPASGRGSGTRGIAPDDQFVFHARQSESRFSRANAYWLVADPTSASLTMGAPLAPPPGAPAEPSRIYRQSLTVEEDRPPVMTKNDQFLTILDHRWVWWTWTETPNPGLPGARKLDQAETITFDLPGLATQGTTVTATAHFYFHSWPGGSTSPVVVRVRVNGGEPVDLRLLHQNDEIKRFEIPVSQLRPAGNTVTLEVASKGLPAGSGDAGLRAPKLELCFDRLELDYPRLYEAGPDGLAFQTPVAGSAPLAPGALRQVEYEIRNVDAVRVPVLFDVTETAPLAVKSAVVGNGTLRFRAAESTTRSYELRYLDDLAVPPLEPLGDQPDLRSPSSRADYIIISHADFIDAMKPFAEAKRAAGHEVALLDVRHVYDQFAAGQETPEAIRAFVRHAVSAWQGSSRAPAASAVLLVGDCTSAYRNQFRNSVINYVPSFSDSGWSESERYASDAWFVQVCGNDLLADALIGRFSVNNVRDLQAILDKQAEYARRAEPGPWRNTVAFVADHSEFEGAVDRVMTQSVPGAYFRKRIRLADEPWADNYYFPVEIAEAKKAKVSPATTARIRDMFNDGAALVTYFGHGSPNIWSNERIWFGGDSENSDNLMLHNRGRYPLIVNMTCNSGAIDYPMPRWNVCISEDFMRIPNAGAVACYVPSGPGITAQHEKLTLELNRSLLEERAGPLGGGLALASWRYLLAGNPPELVRMFILLGDPVLELDLPRPAPEASGAIGQWLAGSSDHPCRPAAPPAVAGSYAQVIRHTENGYSDTGILPVPETPLAVRRDCPGGAEGCGSVPCADLPPRLVSTAADDALRTGATAAFLTGAGSGGAGTSHFAVPVAEAPEVALRSWKAEPAGVISDGQTVRVILTVENTGPLPIRRAVVTLTRTGDADGAPRTPEGRSGPFDLLPGEKRDIEVELRPVFGVNRYEPGLVTGRVEQAGRVLQTGAPVVIAAAPAAGQEGGKPAVLLDPGSVSVRWTRRGSELVAAVRAHAWNVTTYGTGDLMAGLMAADGTVLEDTVTTLPATAPGQKSEFEVRRVYSGKAPVSESLMLRLDPRGTRADYAGAPAVPVPLGEVTMPDLFIPENGITPSDPTPTDGETVFFDVRVINRGGGRAENVKVTAYDGESTAARPLESRIHMTVSELHLDPGASATVRLRWDPFRNAGPHRIRIAATMADSPDRTPEDNERVYPLRVLTKYDLRKGPVAILKPNAEDVANKQIRVVARVYNRGESPAHGVRVVIYPSPEKKKNEVMGDLILDEIPAKSHRDAIVVYKLKPGEESRPFTPVFDAFLKGSLQRAPQEEESSAEPRSDVSATTAADTIGGPLR